MIGVGLVGVGFMGKMHFGVHQGSERSQVVAICDVNEDKLNGDWSSIGGNIDDPSARAIDLSGINKYAKIDELLKDPGVDLVDITLPTYLHCESAIKALEAGKHVLCEKPIALTVPEADRMLEAAGKAPGKFMVAQCIRWWPEYAKTRELIAQRKYGDVVSAMFQRVSPTPTWGWQNWLQDHKKSGGACIDLHIHDIDYINYLFGKPMKVTTTGVTKTSGGLDHMVTTYHYEADNFMVVAEGNWMLHPAAPFEMSFKIVCENATIVYSSSKSKTLVVCTKDGAEEHPEFTPGDGYHNEIEYFLACIEKNEVPSVCTPAEAREAVLVGWAEIDSWKGNGKTVTVGN
jgi:predicted dehydrogenase